MQINTVDNTNIQRKQVAAAKEESKLQARKEKKRNRLQFNMDNKKISDEIDEPSPAKKKVKLN